VGQVRQKGEVMRVVDNKIFIIEDFISTNTANFIVDNFSKNLNPTQHQGVYGGVGSNDNNTPNISGKNKIIKYDGVSDVAIDLFTNLFPSLEKTMCEIFKKDIEIKSFFYSHMKSGGKNPLHHDNYEEKYQNDYSGILYLTDTYRGGSINFPNQKLSMHPKPGTFICFIGDKDVEHEVEEVVDGDRVNVICFFQERRKEYEN
jgi:2OG-Fe(II) oxygenase superfamily